MLLYMLKTAMKITVGLLKASHFGPTVSVISTAFLLSLSQRRALSSLQIAGAVFAGQLIVGWSNDLIDFPLDRAAGRMKKPLVSGEIAESLLKKSLLVAVIAAVILSLLSPMGLKGSIIHILGISSAIIYNLKLKPTILSPVPYVISFGAMPWAVYAAVNENPPLWLYLNFILFSVAFHFLNVLKDLEWDLNQGVLGLPQRIGRTPSLVVALILALSGVLNTIFLRS